MHFIYCKDHKGCGVQGVFVPGPCWTDSALKMHQPCGWDESIKAEALRLSVVFIVTCFSTR